jgi:hypothetical protein
VILVKSFTSTVALLVPISFRPDSTFHIQLLRVTIAWPVNKVANNRVAAQSLLFWTLSAAVFSKLLWLDEKHQFLVIFALTGPLTLLRGA